MYRAFNMGLGMVLVCDPSDVEAVRAQVAEAMVVGEVVAQASGAAGHHRVGQRAMANFRVYYVERTVRDPRLGLARALRHVGR